MKVTLIRELYKIVTYIIIGLIKCLGFRIVLGINI